MLAGIEERGPTERTDIRTAVVGTVRSALTTAQGALMGIVTADGVQARIAAALVLAGTKVDFAQGASLAAVARGNLTFSQAGAQWVVAGGDMQVSQAGGAIIASLGNGELVQGGGMIVAAGGNMPITQGGGVLMLSGGGMSITSGNGLVLAAPRVQAQGVNTGILLAGKVDGTVTTTLGTPQVLMLGAALGIVGGLVFGLVARRRDDS